MGTGDLGSLGGCSDWGWITERRAHFAGPWRLAGLVGSLQGKGRAGTGWWRGLEGCQAGGSRGLAPAGITRRLSALGAVRGVTMRAPCPGKPLNCPCLPGVLACVCLAGGRFSQGHERATLSFLPCSHFASAFLLARAASIPSHLASGCSSRVRQGCLPGAPGTAGYSSPPWLCRQHRAWLRWGETGGCHSDAQCSLAVLCLGCCHLRLPLGGTANQPDNPRPPPAPRPPQHKPSAPSRCSPASAGARAMDRPLQE